MKDRERLRASNLWEPFARKFPPIAKACRLLPKPATDIDRIGGLAEPKGEILTYACAVTDPEVYRHWGTQPPSGLLLIGPPGCGKTMLAEALAVRTDRPFLWIRVPRLILQLLHGGAQPAALLGAWIEALREMPPITVFFDELDFMHSLTLGQPGRELPATGIVEFLLELIDETISIDDSLTVGSTGRPDSLSPVFFEPGRFERVVDVVPIVPDDVIAALQLHASDAEAASGRDLFEAPNWHQVVEQSRDTSIGQWIRLLHAVLRRKARCEAAKEPSGPVTTQDMLDEAARAELVNKRLPVSTGRYL